MINCQKFNFLLFLTINSVTTAVRELNQTSQISLVTHDAKGEMREIKMRYRQVSRECDFMFQRTLMEQASLCIYYMFITVSCVHCSDATVKHEFSEQHMHIVNYLRSLISPIAVYG